MLFFSFLATLCKGKDAPANKVQTLPVSTCRKRIITQRKETDFDCKWKPVPQNSFSPLYTHTHANTQLFNHFFWYHWQEFAFKFFFLWLSFFVKILMIFALMNEYSGGGPGGPGPQAPTFLGQTESCRTGQKTFLRLSFPVVP